MATYTTNSGLEFKQYEGSRIGTKYSNEPFKVKGVKLKVIDGGAAYSMSYNGKDFRIPYEDMVSLKIDGVVEAIKATEDKGRPLSKQEYQNIIGGSASDNKWAFYNYLLDENSDSIGFDSSVYTDTDLFDQNGKLKKGADFSKYVSGEMGQPGKDTQSPFNSDGSINTNYIGTLQEQAYKNYADLMVDPNSQYGQQQARALYENIDSQEAQMSALLGDSELQAYKMLGQQQLELENTIAEQRMKALKSGTTSAQLAAQQIASMFASQAGAAQVSQNLNTQKIDFARMFSEQRGQVMPSIYEQANANRTTLATAGAQNYAGTAGLVSYANQQAGNLLASNNFLKKYGKGSYKDIMNPTE